MMQISTLATKRTRRHIAPTDPVFSPNGVYDIGGLSKRLGYSRKTIARMRANQQLPPPFFLNKQSKRPFWRGDVLLAHFDRLQSRSTFDAGKDETR